MSGSIIRMSAFSKRFVRLDYRCHRDMNDENDELTILMEMCTCGMGMGIG